MINLDWKNSPDAVIKPFEGMEDIPVELDESFDQLQTTDILNQTGQGKTLLILGEPGSGKTIALLQLAKKLIDQTEQDLTKPIPVVFNLSSWGHKQQPIEKWLIEELKDKYQVPQTWSEPWSEQEQLILLLDGLDEVQAGKRDACVRALNKFIATHNVTEMVVCSRVKDYEALTERLKLSSAICIKPLSQRKLYEFLDKAGSSLAGLKILLQQDRELEKFAQTPLILNIMSVAYQDWSIKDLLREFLSSEDRYRHLFDSYIERMLRHRVSGKTEQKNNSPQYPQEKVLHWLSWLAKTMVNESKIIFLIEKMQPSLLESPEERRKYRISNFSFGWQIYGVIAGLIGGTIFGLIEGTIFGLKNFGAVFGVIYGVIAGLTYGLINGSFVLFICGIVGKLIAKLSKNTILKEIILFEQVNWSWERANSKIIPHLKIGLFYGLFYGLLNTAIYLLIGKPELIFSALIGGVIYGAVVSILISGLSTVEIKQKTSPNQGIWSSMKSSIKIGLIYGLRCGLIFGLISGIWSNDNEIDLILKIYNLVHLGKNEPVARLIVGLISMMSSWLMVGVILGLMNGGVTCIRHFNLRRILYRQGRIPWNYARFLDYASERLLMKKVGGGYIFYHRMLMEHFAQRHQASTVPVTVTPRQTSQPVAQAKTRTKVRSSNISNPVPPPSNPVPHHIVCGNCDHQNPTNGKFCIKCGTKLSQKI